MLSREEAGVIALREVLARQLGTGVRDVYRLHELRFRKPMIYNGPALERCWIAYVERPVRGLGPSTIVLIDAENGAVLYAGSANDEG